MRDHEGDNMKVLHCRDAGFDCDAVVRGETEDDILEQVGPHASGDHGVEVTPELVESLRPLMRDEPEGAPA